MTQISVERKHSLGREAARAKAEALVERLSREYDLKATWDGDRVDVARSGAKGSVHIGEDRQHPRRSEAGHDAVDDERDHQGRDRAGVGQEPGVSAWPAVRQADAL